MARLGMNPHRGTADLSPPSAICLTMITHLPYIAGYHKHRAEIIELSLESMIKGAEGIDFEVGIFDNGSCREWTDKLDSFVASGYINWVWKSHKNIGKPNALRRLLSGVQSGIIGYSDDDILFYPQWILHQLPLLAKWPNVAKVSGVPVKSLFPHYLDQCQYDFEGNIRDMPDDDRVVTKVTKAEWPMDWVVADALGRGMPMEIYMDTHGDDDEISLEYKGAKAWGHGHHCQFIGYRETLLRYFPDDTEFAMGKMREWDNKVQDSGRYQITTEQRTARHIGNLLDKPTMEEAIAIKVVV